jgi:hypothetical protein
VQQLPCGQVPKAQLLRLAFLPLAAAGRQHAPVGREGYRVDGPFAFEPPRHRAGRRLAHQDRPDFVAAGHGLAVGGVGHGLDLRLVTAQGIAERNVPRHVKEVDVSVPQGGNVLPVGRKGVRHGQASKSPQGANRRGGVVVPELSRARARRSSGRRPTRPRLEAPTGSAEAFTSRPVAAPTDADGSVGRTGIIVLPSGAARPITVLPCRRTVPSRAHRGAGGGSPWWSARAGVPGLAWACRSARGRSCPVGRRTVRPGRPYRCGSARRWLTPAASVTSLAAPSSRSHRPRAAVPRRPQRRTARTAAARGGGTVVARVCGGDRAASTVAALHPRGTRAPGTLALIEPAGERPSLGPGARRLSPPYALHAAGEGHPVLLRQPWISSSRGLCLALRSSTGSCGGLAAARACECAGRRPRRALGAASKTTRGATRPGRPFAEVAAFPREEKVAEGVLGPAGDEGPGGGRWGPSSVTADQGGESVLARRAARREAVRNGQARRGSAAATSAGVGQLFATPSAGVPSRNTDLTRTITAGRPNSVDEFRAPRRVTGRPPRTTRGPAAAHDLTARWSFPPRSKQLGIPRERVWPQLPLPTRSAPRPRLEPGT